MAANIDMMKEETENTFTQSERTIYVAGLARNTTDDDLQAYFFEIWVDCTGQSQNRPNFRSFQRICFCHIQ